MLGPPFPCICLPPCASVNILLDNGRPCPERRLLLWRKVSTVEVASGHVSCSLTGREEFFRNMERRGEARCTCLVRERRGEERMMRVEERRGEKKIGEERRRVEWRVLDKGKIKHWHQPYYILTYITAVQSRTP